MIIVEGKDCREKDIATMEAKTIALSHLDLYIYKLQT